ncbi:MAG: ferritin [Thermonema sp.]|uniref:ferritin n=1 Tax=Thermonema sp. TaxID=2231181 RepID=UPI0021DC394A|nr:ferritin [Thermonema sp.]GIV39184.1 MAG: ferritin [Thermonema sp.]
MSKKKEKKEEKGRRKTSLQSEIEQALNEQVKREALSSANYLAMASWCDVHGFENSANFFYRQSDEERTHMLKIFKYINDMGGHAVTPSIEAPKQNYNSLRAVFEAALENEIEVTQSIRKIVDMCREHHDYATEMLMQWFVREQVEEEYIARRCLELFDIIGEEGLGLFMIDQQIPNISYTSPDTEA